MSLRVPHGSLLSSTAHKERVSEAMWNELASSTRLTALEHREQVIALLPLAFIHFARDQQSQGIS